jgi:hypothetical protein
MATWVVWIIGTIISLLFVVLTWRQSSAPKVNSLIAGLIGLLLTIAVDVRLSIYSLNDVFKERDEKMAAVFGPMYKAAQSDVLRPVVFGLLDTQERLQERANDVLSRVYSARLEQVAESLFPMQSGRMEVDERDLLSFTTLVIRSAQVSVDATSYVDPATWWTSGLGPQYLVANSDAITRGVKIRRIFIFRDTAECLAARDILSDQLALGVDLYVAFEGNLPSSSRADVIIVDNALSGRMDLSNRAGRGAVFLSDEFSIREVQSVFETAVKNAHPAAQGCTGDVQMRL